MRRSRRNNKNSKRERILMLASSAFVLAALTMTGVYVKNNSDSNKNDGYNLDLSGLENNLENDSIQEKDGGNLNQAGNEWQQTPQDDLDYTPMEPVDSGEVKIPGLTMDNIDGTQTPLLSGIAGRTVSGGDADTDEPEDEPTNSNGSAGEGTGSTGDKKKIVNVPDFQTGDTLVWPVVGNVLIPYSMDKTVYFSTLAQYKYNPGMVIAATEGDGIYAAAAGKVTQVTFDEEIGNIVTVDIGKGYETTYGQLKDVEVSVGSYVEKGDVLGYVAAPTKYYSVEGTNAYFALTLNGEPVNPLGELQ